MFGWRLNSAYIYSERLIPINSLTFEVFIWRDGRLFAQGRLSYASRFSLEVLENGFENVCVQLISCSFDRGSRNKRTHMEGENIPVDKSDPFHVD